MGVFGSGSEVARLKARISQLERELRASEAQRKLFRDMVGTQYPHLDEHDYIRRAETVIESVRSILILHDEAKGRVTAEQTLLSLRATLKGLQAEILDVNDEERERMRPILERYCENLKPFREL